MRRRLPPPWALTALMALVYVLIAPPTTDLAAQSHRVTLARDGVWLYDLSWFGGHHLPGYSVLTPVLGLVLGAAAIGAVSAVPAAWAFSRLVRDGWPGRGGTVAAWWFAGGVGALLFTGRSTFVLGAAVALLTLLLARPAGTAAPQARPVAGPADPDGRAARPVAPAAHPTADAHPARLAGVAVGAVLTALASPVAALFLAMAAGAWWLSALRRVGGDGRGVRVAFLLTASSLVAALALSAAFPVGGSEPFVASALWPAVVVLAIVLVVLPREARALRIGVAVYLLGVLLAGALPTPMGGNATRLAALAGGPLVAGALWGRRPVALTLLAVPLLWWQWYPPVRDATQAWSDPSARAAYWAPLARQLEARLAAEPGRVEVPPTARRGEARWLSPAIPLARGWIRQLDRDRNALFYDDLAPALTATAYRRWLDEDAVSWVALPDATPDGASRAEVALLRAGRVPGLRRVWSDAHWSLWRVERGRALASWSGPDRPGPVPRTLRAGPGSVTFQAPRAGSVDLRIRWSPYLRIVHGRGCVVRGADGWTVVRTAVPGRITTGVGPAAPWRRPDPQDCTP